MMISCREAARLSSESLDRPLLFWERVALRFHLAICVTCSRYDEQVQFMAKLFECLRSDDEKSCELPGVKLTPEARERLRKSLSL